MLFWSKRSTAPSDGVPERRPRLLQPLAPQPGEVDSLLPVDGHRRAARGDVHGLAPPSSSVSSRDAIGDRVAAGVHLAGEHRPYVFSLTTCEHSGGRRYYRRLRDAGKRQWPVRAGRRALVPRGSRKAAVPRSRDRARGDRRAVRGELAVRVVEPQQGRAPDDAAVRGGARDRGARPDARRHAGRHRPLDRRRACRSTS